ncbi:MAG: type II toxin-antitoxin system Phd/YefM family antitoxin [Nitrospirae bacterium]|nr:type II toxin-antitoxin system Phd/YefM family antitoxin [Nitrospirota bacterium]MBF0542182.1 type II toxin-antitoxin system Phd/YefM family antitoxin [Nitrospirota bacterium]
MNTISLQKASDNLTQIVNSTIRNNEETLIVSDDGCVVLINQDEWENMKETLSILNDETSLKALVEGHRDRLQNKQIKAKTINEAFYDL